MDTNWVVSSPPTTYQLQQKTQPDENVCVKQKIGKKGTKERYGHESGRIKLGTEICKARKGRETKMIV